MSPLLHAPEAQQQKDATTGTGEPLDHIYCPCDPNLGLCGYDLTGYTEVEAFASDDECIVCADLELAPCPRCGA